MRRQQQKRSRQLSLPTRGKFSEPLPKGAIAYLIVVLQANHISRQRHVGRGGAARAFPEVEIFSLEYKTLVERAHDLLRLAEILVIALALAGQESVHALVKIIAPQGIETVTAAARRTHQLGIVLIRLADHADLAS